MITWKNDGELFALIRVELYSAVIGDILDKLHYYHQFLPYKVQPAKEHTVMADQAMTVLEAGAFEELSTRQNTAIQKPLKLVLETLSDIKKDEAYIYTGSSPSYIPAGELMCARV